MTTGKSKQNMRDLVNMNLSYWRWKLYPILEPEFRPEFRKTIRLFEIKYPTRGFISRTDDRNFIYKETEK